MIFMPRTARAGLVRAIALIAAALFAGLSLPACGSGPTFPVSQRPYTGPPVDIQTDEGSDEHIVVITAPTGGWMARYDGLEPRFGRDDVFITLVSPDPTGAVTQALVTHHVDTPVDVQRPMQAWVRVLEFEATIADDAPPGNPVDWVIDQVIGDDPPPPYHLAASTQP